MTEHPSGRRFRVRYWSAAGVLFAGWLVVGYLLVPRLVRSAYEGTSVEILNRLISGQDLHSVDRYLAQATAFAHRVTIALALVIAAGFAAWVWRARLRRGWRALTREGACGPARDLLIASAWFGLAFGFLEAVLAWVRFRSLGIVTVFNDPDALWTAPLGLGLLFGVGALALVTLVGGWKKERSYRLFVGVCALLGVNSLVRGLDLGLPPLRIGIHPLAIWVLALAFAVQIVKWVDSRPLSRRFIRASALPLAATFVAAPFIPAGLDRLIEARRLAVLPDTHDAPNIIFIVLDTVRKQSLGLHGYGRPNTPELEALASRAVVFERALATSSWTLPTHGSLFTGRYPYELSTDRQ